MTEREQDIIKQFVELFKDSWITESREAGVRVRMDSLAQFHQLLILAEQPRHKPEANSNIKLLSFEQLQNRFKEAEKWLSLNSKDVALKYAYRALRHEIIERIKLYGQTSITEELEAIKDKPNESPNDKKERTTVAINGTLIYKGRKHEYYGREFRVTDVKGDIVVLKSLQGGEVVLAVHISLTEPVR